MKAAVSFLPFQHLDPSTGPLAEASLSDATFQRCRTLDRKQGDVWVSTSFDMTDVSACGAGTIFNFCKPSRVLTERTRAIFVIHEFGVPYPDTPRHAEIAAERSIPLIKMRKAAAVAEVVRRP